MPPCPRRRSRLYLAVPRKPIAVGFSRRGRKGATRRAGSELEGALMRLRCLEEPRSSVAHSAALRQDGQMAAAVAESERPARARVLLADDDPLFLRTFVRSLTAAGHDVTAATNGREAALLLGGQPFDVVVSDISMPEMGGIELLRLVRARDPDLPVVLITGAPAVETAVMAVEHGALRYLVKPFDAHTLDEAVTRALRGHRVARLKRDALAMLGNLGLGPGPDVADRPALEASFGRALDALWMAYQPIVQWSSRTVYGYEALVRTREPALPHPGALFDAAARLHRLEELGRTIRRMTVIPMPQAPPEAHLFVNLHPHDLLDDMLLDSDSPLLPIAPRVILEITERAPLHEVKDAFLRIAELRKRGFRIAVDDLGAGYAGLISFAQIEPDVIKLDMAIIRDVDRAPTKQKLVRSMVELCRETNTLMVAEGVETAAERDTLIGLGCDYLQGYLFARPGEPFPSPTF
ncbi:MAG: EAL domain-containing response regulator [Myxococcales bacterium]|nr:EAL domain-containing response regulator [Myxococcales bacterium]